MNDLDLRLRDAGARLRDTAPSAAATEAALASLGDVELDGHASRRSRLWIVGPAVLAAAAAVVGAIVLTRPEQQAVVPADTTLAPAPPSSSVVSAPTTTVSPTTSTIGVAELGFGVTLQWTSENFDGDGGACLTLSTSTDSATGCAGGPTMRSSRPLSLHLDGTPYSFFRFGEDGSGAASLSDEAVPCLADVNTAGTIHDIVSCTDDGTGVVGTLPAEPGGAVTWTLLGAERAPDGVGLELLTSPPINPAHVFRSAATEQVPACLVIVAVDGSVREACVDDSVTLLAGSTDQPVVVAYDAVAATASATTLDPAATLGVSGCIDLTAGALLGLLPERGTVDSLLCGGDAGVALQPAVLLHAGPPDGSINMLARAPEGTWSLADSGTGITCDDGVNNQACADIGITDVLDVPQFPAASSIGAFGEAVVFGGTFDAAAPIVGRPAEELAAIQSAGDLQALADAIVAELEAQGAEPGQATVTNADASPVVVRRSNMDDSLTHTVFTAFAAPSSDGGLVVTATRAVDICGRGTTALEVGAVCI
jgi:hypothetical protein